MYLIIYADVWYLNQYMYILYDTANLKALHNNIICIILHMEPAFYKNLTLASRQNYKAVQGDAVFYLLIAKYLSF